MDNITELKRRIFDSEERTFSNLPLEDIVQVNGAVRKDIDTGNFSLGEVLEFLAREQNETKNAFLVPEHESGIEIEDLDKVDLLLESKLKEKDIPSILLYEVKQGLYYVYLRKKEEEKDEKEEKPIKKEEEEEEEETNKYLFVPADIMVRRVPQYILGTGILGRAFIHMNYIEVLDSLFGPEYIEVLTHEILHIRYPQKGEIEIRLITRNYIANPIYN
ncbi:hypothetical protein JW930_01660 [Candidatus Woesearchaeota archaeon]|nr:hypothetical protein [Candidatus Woesearchaeota archaeon]